MLRLVSVAFALTSLACVVPLQRADAATFDFATLAQTPGAQGGGEGFWANQITTAGDVYTVGGIGVVATASGATSGAASKAYLDAFSGGLPAGLGVCSTSGQCKYVPIGREKFRREADIATHTPFALTDVWFGSGRVAGFLVESTLSCSS